MDSPQLPDSKRPLELIMYLITTAGFGGWIAKQILSYQERRKQERDLKSKADEIFAEYERQIILKAEQGREKQFLWSEEQRDECYEKLAHAEEKCSKMEEQRDGFRDASMEKLIKLEKKDAELKIAAETIARLELLIAALEAAKKKDG